MEYNRISKEILIVIGIIEKREMVGFEGEIDESAVLEWGVKSGVDIFIHVLLALPKYN